MDSVGNCIGALNSALDAHSGIMEQLIGSLMQPLSSSVSASQSELLSSFRSSALQEQGIGQTLDVVA